MIRTLATLCAIVPVAAIAYIVGTTVYQSLPALRQVGLALVKTEQDSQYSLRAPIWGTVVVAFEALAIGLPIALAIAIVMRELRLPLLSRSLGAIMGTLAGIPPIIYAVCTLLVVQSFMAPKFAAPQLSDPVKASILGEPSVGFGGLPDRIPNTSFLGGAMLALLIIPFMTPLIVDALRGVPGDLKNGSYALGASRWYTLRHVVLPWAFPGIVSAATLGCLVAIGEVVIPYFVLGGAENLAHVPNPIWDIYRPTPALTAWGASLMGGFSSENEGVVALPVSVSFVSGLVLLILALVVMSVEQLILKSLRRGMV